MTGTPSAVTWTSNSTKVAPHRTASWNDLSVFSRYCPRPCVRLALHVFIPILQGGGTQVRGIGPAMFA